MKLKTLANKLEVAGILTPLKGHAISDTRRVDTISKVIPGNKIMGIGRDSHFIRLWKKIWPEGQST